MEKLSMGFSKGSNKKESDDSTRKTNENIEKQGQIAVSKIKEVQDEADSINRNLKSKAQESFQALENLNEKISQANNDLSNKLSSISNPLEPFMIDGYIEIDYSEFSDSDSILHDFKKYLESFEKYSVIRDLSFTHKLPQSLIVRYVSGESGEIRGIKNPNLKFKLNQYDSNNIQYALAENNVLKLYFPEIIIAFNSTKKSSDPKYSADLVYDLNGYESKSAVDLHYDIDLTNKKIKYFFKVPIPTLIHSNPSGKVKSLFDCKDGNVAIGFNCSNGIKVNYQYMRIIYGKEFKNEVYFNIARDENKNPLILF